MKIIKNRTIDEKTLFECTVLFEEDWEEHRTEEDVSEISDICCWISNTFSKNFIVLEHTDTIIAGGCVDNASAWNNGYENHTNIAGKQWELRCYESDRTLFLLRYSENKDI